MSNTNTGGPAFPYEERDYSGNPSKDHFGMTLRDYFAAKAMQAMVTDASWQGGTCKTVAAVSYEMADAMLKAREA
jgi:hypothetical protein